MGRWLESCKAQDESQWILNGSGVLHVSASLEGSIAIVILHLHIYQTN